MGRSIMNGCRFVCAQSSLYLCLSSVTARLLKPCLESGLLTRNCSSPFFARRVAYNRHCFTVLPGPLEKE